MENVTLPVFCCLRFLDYNIMAVYRDLNVTYKIFRVCT